jgi:WhiB family transcriptional regulator, redox-sensing transcriptional regulator
VTGPAQPMIAEHRVDTTWHQQGACRDANEKLFYHPEGERGATRLARADAAKRVCWECPVRQICREQSVERRESHGTWGALSEDDRAALRSGLPIEGAKASHPRPAPRRITVQATAAAGVEALAPLVLDESMIPADVRRVRIRDVRVAAHVHSLMEAGYGPKSIAIAAGVSAETVRSIANGRAQVIEQTAALLLAVRPEAIEVAA